MTVAHETGTSRTITRLQLIRALFLAAIVLVTVVGLLGAFGLPGTAPSYDIVPDPAAPLGF